jgi:hypothetical protein
MIFPIMLCVERGATLLVLLRVLTSQKCAAPFQSRRNTPGTGPSAYSDFGGHAMHIALLSQRDASAGSYGFYLHVFARIGLRWEVP